MRKFEDYKKDLQEAQKLAVEAVENIEGNLKNMPPNKIMMVFEQIGLAVNYMLIENYARSGNDREYINELMGSYQKALMVMVDDAFKRIKFH